MKELDRIERLEVEYIKSRVTGDGSIAGRMSEGGDIFAPLNDYKPQLDEIADQIRKAKITNPADIEKRAIALLYPPPSQ